MMLSDLLQLRKFLWVSSIFWMQVCAQQLPPLANFANNQLVYNPAAAGMMETELNVNFLSRMQWSGLKGAPTSYMLWSDYRLGDNKSALGLNVNAHSYGVTKATDIAGNYSYSISFKGGWKLSMGLKLGLSVIKINDLPADRIWDTDDPTANTYTPNSTIPQIGTGFRFYNKKFYASIAAPDLIALDRDNIYHNKDRAFFDKKRNYVVQLGYRAQLSDAYALGVHALFYAYPSKKPRADLNATFEIRDYFWAGATYSSSKYHSLLVGTHVSSALKATYAFQFGLGPKIPAHYFTHEISLLLNLDLHKK